MWRYADIRTVPDIIRHWSAAAPQRVALVEGPRQVTYRELDDRSSQLARALLAAGARPGSHIGYLGKNSASFFEVWLGAVKAGSAIAPFNWRSSPAELAELIDDAQAPVVFVSEELKDRLAEVSGRVRSSFLIVSDLDLWLSPHPADDPHVPLAGPETALLTYTSGTTGRPKGVQLSHDAFNRSFLCSALEPCLEMDSDDVLLMAMPNFHLTGSWVSLPALYHGADLDPPLLRADEHAPRACGRARHGDLPGPGGDAGDDGPSGRRRGGLLRAAPDPVRRLADQRGDAAARAQPLRLRVRAVLRRDRDVDHVAAPAAAA